MPERTVDESGYQAPEFPYRQLPRVVEGIEGILELVNREKRSLLDFNMIAHMLPASSRGMFEEALWRVVEIASRQGVLPLIIEVDKVGNPLEHSQN